MAALRLGFSPCPNDTFMFEALVHNRVNLPCSLAVDMLDVEALNNKALIGELDITKVSFAVFPFISAQYQLLSSGAALGRGCGPLLVSRRPLQLQELDENMRVAIPGMHTTAHLLLRTFFPQLKNTTAHVFSDIESAVLSGDSDLGLLIHETRFTFRDNGLFQVADLGERWETEFGLPLPLGGIAIRRSLDQNLKLQMEEALRNSVRFACDHPDEGAGYVRKHAAAMDEAVQRKHIALYVNDFSLELGSEGQRAVRKFFDAGHNSGLLPEVHEPAFVNEKFQETCLS